MQRGAWSLHQLLNNCALWRRRATPHLKASGALSPLQWPRLNDVDFFAGTQAVQAIQVQGVECRALVIGSTMGVAPLMALRAGAVHVTVLER